MDIRINQAFDEILAAYPKSEFEALAENLRTGLNKEQLPSSGGDFSLVLRPAFLPIESYRSIREAAFYLTSAVRKATKALIKERILANELCLNEHECRLAQVDPLYDAVFTNASWVVSLENGKPQFSDFGPDSASEMASNEEQAGPYMSWEPMARMQALYDIDFCPSGIHLFQEVLKAYETYRQKKQLTTVQKKPVILIADWLEEHGAANAERLAAYGKAQSHDLLIADPRTLDFRGNALYSSGQAVDVVWRIFQAHDMILRKNDCEDLLEAYTQHAVCMTDSFRVKYVDKRGFLSVLTDERFERIFSRYEREAIRTFIPWTRRFEEAFTRYKGKKVDLPEFVLENKDKLVLKSNDRITKNGARKGSEMSESDWCRSLEAALKDEGQCWIVQEYVGSENELFPVLHNGDLGFESYEVQVVAYVVGDMADDIGVRLSKRSGGTEKEGIKHLPAFIVSRKQAGSKKQLSSN